MTTSLRPQSSARRGLWAAFACALTFGSGCAGKESFGTTFPVNRRDQVEAVLTRAQQGGRARPAQVVVGVIEQPRGLFAFDLGSQRLLFQQKAEVSGTPAIAGPYTIVPEGATIRVRKLSDGASILDLPAEGMHLIGADSDGTLTAIVLSTGGSMGARSKLVLLENGAVSSTRAIPHHVGGPAVLGGLAFVPHNRVHVSVVDAQGTELARVQVREDVASQAMATERDVYFGLAGVYRFDDKSALGASGGAHYFKVKLEEKLPGQPAFLPNTAEPAPAVNSAVHRVSLGFVPEMRGQSLELRDDAYYLLFYRQLYAIDSHALSPHWVRQLGTDAVGLRAVQNGAIVVEEGGKVAAFGPQGALQWSADMGVRPVLAVIQATELPGGAAAEPPGPLSMQLVNAALNPDTRLVPARAMAVNMLASMQDEEATPALIAICQDRATPERVRKVACVALSKRTNGAGAIAQALNQHADFLTQTKAPPVGPLAEAAMHNGDASVVPQLLSQLADPATPSSELPALMLALKQLATAEAVPQIAEFLRLYHADADEPRMSDALVIAIETLVRLQGSSAQGVLEPIANDAFSATPVRAAAAQMLAEILPAAAPSDASASAAKPTGSPAEPQEEPKEEGPPAFRTVQHVERALLPVAAKLSECVRNSPKRPNSARLTLVLGGNGDVLAVETLPADVKACIEPLVLSVPFPPNKYGKRETLTYTIPR